MPLTSKTILIVEDTPTMAMVCQEYLRSQHCQTRIAATGAEALTAIRQQTPDAILLDIGLPDMNGIDLMKRLRDDGLRAAIVIMTGKASLNIAVQAMQSGADDFIAKPFNAERLHITVANALEKKRLEKLVSTYKDLNSISFSGFIGNSAEMQAVYHMIKNAAHSTAPVMITGESGTGKELTAQAVHNLSTRKDKALVALNCAAIPHDLLESEIFGHVKGAFTGATMDRDGAAKRANDGTLFLDELTEMPLGLQSKLLRFAQTGAFTPVGGGQTIEADIRFVCATNRDPLMATRHGQLREDLYYRLSVIPITLPPLRDRRDDIIMLSEHFLEKAAQKEKKNFYALDEGARTALKNYDWPGNVRELENVIRHAVIMNTGEVITADMLRFSHLRAPIPVSDLPVLHDDDDFTFHSADDIRPLAQMENEIIQNAIGVCGGNITEAARRLGINPSTIHRKQKQKIT
jgi:DNA-binding NtrC family response regulator